jgi:hypothetical protein
MTTDKPLIMTYGDTRVLFHCEQGGCHSETFLPGLGWILDNEANTTALWLAVARIHPVIDEEVLRAEAIGY